MPFLDRQDASIRDQRSVRGMPTTLCPSLPLTGFLIALLSALFAEHLFCDFAVLRHSAKGAPFAVHFAAANAAADSERSAAADAAVKASLPHPHRRSGGIRVHGLASTTAMPTMGGSSTSRSGSGRTDNNRRRRDEHAQYAHDRNHIMSEATREMISFVFENYRQHAFPFHDEVRPNSCRGANNSLLGSGAFTATLIDSLDTLAIVSSTAHHPLAHRSPLSSSGASSSGLQTAFWESVAYICTDLSERVFGRDHRDDVGADADEGTSSSTATTSEDAGRCSSTSGGRRSGSEQQSAPQSSLLSPFIDVSYVAPRRTCSQKEAAQHSFGSSSSSSSSYSSSSPCGCPFSDPLRQTPAVNPHINGFETNIRIIGGLLSGHFMIEEGVVSPVVETEAQTAVPMSSNVEGRAPDAATAKKTMVYHYDGCLLRLALAIGRQFLPLFDTPTGIPYGSFFFRDGVREGEIQQSSVSESGTYLLEFTLLSRVSGDPRFERVAKRAARAIFRRRHPHTNLLGTHLNVTTGAWSLVQSTIGSGIDSYLEYLVKQFLLTGEKEFYLMFDVLHQGIYNYLRVGSGEYNDDMAGPSRKRKEESKRNKKKRKGNADGDDDDEPSLLHKVIGRKRPPTPIQQRPTAYYQTMAMTASAVLYPANPHSINIDYIQIKNGDGTIVEDQGIVNTIGLRHLKKTLGNGEHGSLCNFYPGLLALAGHVDEAKVAIHSQQHVWETYGAFPESFEIGRAQSEGVLSAVGAGAIMGPSASGTVSRRSSTATNVFWTRLSKKADQLRAMKKRAEEEAEENRMKQKEADEAAAAADGGGEVIQTSPIPPPTTAPSSSSTGNGANPPQQQQHHHQTEHIPQTTSTNYPLRPEHIESLYVLYETTRDDTYVDMAARVVLAIEARTRSVCGFTALEDVEVLTPPGAMRARLERSAAEGLLTEADHDQPLTASSVRHSPLLKESVMPRSLWELYFGPEVEEHSAPAQSANEEEEREAPSHSTSSSPSPPTPLLPSNSIDQQESFIMSETLKYAFLLFTQEQREEQSAAWAEGLLHGAASGREDSSGSSSGDDTNNSSSSSSSQWQPRPFLQRGDVKTHTLFHQWQQKALAECDADAKAGGGGGVPPTTTINTVKDALCASIRARRHSLLWVFNTEGHPFPVRPEWSPTYSLGDSSARSLHWMRCCPAKAYVPQSSRRMAATSSSTASTAAAAPVAAAAPYLSSLAEAAAEVAKGTSREVLKKQLKRLKRLGEGYRRRDDDDDYDDDDDDGYDTERQMESFIDNYIYYSSSSSSSLPSSLPSSAHATDGGARRKRASVRQLMANYAEERRARQMADKAERGSHALRYYLGDGGEESGGEGSRLVPNGFYDRLYSKTPSEYYGCAAAGERPPLSSSGVDAAVSPEGHRGGERLSIGGSDDGEVPIDENDTAQTQLGPSSEELQLLRSGPSSSSSEGSNAAEGSNTDAVSVSCARRAHTTATTAPHRPPPPMPPRKERVLNRSSLSHPFRRGAGDVLEELEPIFPYHDPIMPFEVQGYLIPPRYLNAMNRYGVDVATLMEEELGRRRKAAIKAYRALQKKQRQNEQNGGLAKGFTKVSDEELGLAVDFDDDPDSIWTAVAANLEQMAGLGSAASSSRGGTATPPLRSVQTMPYDATLFRRQNAKFFEELPAAPSSASTKGNGHRKRTGAADTGGGGDAGRSSDAKQQRGDSNAALQRLHDQAALAKALIASAGSESAGMAKALSTFIASTESASASIVVGGDGADGADDDDSSVQPMRLSLDPTPLSCPSAKGPIHPRMRSGGGGRSPKSYAKAADGDDEQQRQRRKKRAAIEAKKSLRLRNPHRLLASQLVNAEAPANGDGADSFVSAADDDSFFESMISSEYLLMPTARSYAE